MIKLYRIGKSDYIEDLSGTGARLYGGRWNHPGYPVVYTSGSRSLAALEFLVHVPMALAPDDLSIAEINIPETVKKDIILPTELPSSWRDYPAPEHLQEIGTEWLKSATKLLFDVPSAVVDKEFNTLLNPIHLDMNKVSIASVETFSFDSRLFK